MRIFLASVLLLAAPLTIDVAIAATSPAQPVAGAQAQVANKLPDAVPLATSFPVLLKVNLSISTTHPLARHWGLHCGAIVGAPAALSLVHEAVNTARNDFEIKASTPTEQAAYDKFAQTILSPAHYWGSDVMISGELKDGIYEGQSTVTAQVPVTQLIDPATKSVYAQPEVLIGCWITINERPAIRTRNNELATKDNFNHVTMNYLPYFLTEAIVKSASP
jgi:hypothetical protein